MTQPSSFIPFNRPDISESEISAVVEVLESGILTNGKKTLEFEQAFANELGGDYGDIKCVAINSCTAGLILALHSLGIGKGDEVITSALTFTATVEAIVAVGAKPVLTDIDPLTFNLDLNYVDRLIRPATKAIIPVHFAGLVCDMDSLRDVSIRWGVKIIEDAAHAMGSSWQDTSIGSFDFTTTVFSFYPGKPITTGEGGMIATKNSRLAEMMRCARLHGIARSINSPGWDYKVAMHGFKCNMSELNAAMGIVQLKRFAQMTQRRLDIANLYNNAFKELPRHGFVLPPQPAHGNLHSWHLYILQVPPDVIRARILDSLLHLGIGTSVHYAPIFAHPYWAKTLDIDPSLFPHCQDYWKRAFSLPIYSLMTDDQVEQVVQSVLTVASGTMI